MSRPERGYRTEIFSDRTRYVKNIQEKPYWENDFRDAITLLEQKLLNFIRLNTRLRENIGRRDRFLQVKDSTIHINLIEFKEAYLMRFVNPDFEKYCNNFIALLEPVLADFLKEIQYGGHGFAFHFRLQGQEYKKGKTVLMNHAAD